MTTKIFNNLDAFLTREDKLVNGVDRAFAAKNKSWEEDNKTNQGCWNCHSCDLCMNSLYCINCTMCEGCNLCIKCFGCEDCNEGKSLLGWTPVYLLDWSDDYE